jgi:hypothetical protein
METLLDEVSAFLVERGGYERLTAELQMLLIPCLVANQYVLKRQDGVITAFLCYWKLDREGIAKAAVCEQPQNIYTGNWIYIVEAGNSDSRKTMRALVSAVREKEPHYIAIACHRRGKFTIKRQSGRR